ncbi:chitinase, partial [Escherichia coli]|nr:chitinase [Escherichia coli]
VGYQTPYTAFKEGDYAKCVQSHFNVNIVDDSGQSEDITPVKPDDTTPAQETNVAPVARIAGPIGAIEAGARVSLSA